MAGGKQTPRQKMINLMYLVFIAMMALNMSKEVLSAFGLMNEKFEAANSAAALENETLLDEIKRKAQDDPTRYSEPYDKAKQISLVSNEFFNFIGGLKSEITEKVVVDETGIMPYEQMDKGDIVDSGWFVGDSYSDKGNDIINKFAKYRQDIKAIVGIDKKYQFFNDNLDSKFNTDDVLPKQAGAKPRPFLEYHYKGFPAIASLAKLSALQNDVREIEQEALNILLGNTLKQAASMKNYQAFVITDKSVYFTGEPIKGKVVLGRFDEKTVPTSVHVNGASVKTINGQVQLNMTAGSIGEHKFAGKFVFMEDGVSIPVEIQNSNYVVVPRPNTATISAEKMNVVYAGLDNPISVSFAGVPNDKVTVSSSIGGLTKTGDGKYNIKPTSGRELVITASGTLPDGKVVSDKRVFRVKPIPQPQGIVRGEPSPKGPVSNLGAVTVGVRMPDFDFDVNLIVTEFTVVFPKGSVRIEGTKLNDEAKRLAESLKPGDVVKFINIKSKMSGAPIIVKPSTDAIYTIQ